MSSTPVTLPTSLEEWPRLLTNLEPLSQDDPELYRACLRYLARSSTYFLLRYLMRRKDLEHPWLFERCQEADADPYGHLDLWGRFHYKSTIHTVAGSIKRILRSHGDDPLDTDGECSICIFSHTRPIAKKFLLAIKEELERNENLQTLFPDILYSDPAKQASKWGEDAGVVVIRQASRKESTVEAWGLVDGQPTGAHFTDLTYDDVVVDKSVTTPEMIQKTTSAMELSFNLGIGLNTRRKFVGTRYHSVDTYHTIIERGIAVPRLHPTCEGGTPDGTPVYLSREEVAKLRRDLGPYTFACQHLLNPIAESAQRFDRGWLRYYSESRGETTGAGMNIYMLVDPASKKKKKNDWTTIVVVGIAADHNKYLLDVVRDKLGLKERALAVIGMHRKWTERSGKPLSNTAYEEYGLQADIEYLDEKMDELGYRFGIQAVGGQMAKEDRIRRLQPEFADGKWFFPPHRYYTNYENRDSDLITELIDHEMMLFPTSVHDDMLDAMARIYDIPTIAPRVAQQKDRYAKQRTRNLMAR